MKLIQELIALNEGAMKDVHADLLAAIEGEFKLSDSDPLVQKIADYLIDGTDDDKVDAFLYDHFASSGDMPYGVAKARTGDPDNWIADEMANIFKKELQPIWATWKANRKS